MAGDISISNNFNNNPNIRKILDLTAEKVELEKSIDGSTAPRYIDLSELQQSGKSSIYNQSLADLSMAEVYKSTHISVNSKLTKQEVALEQIISIINQLKIDYFNVGEGFEIVNKDDVCNKALEQISAVLNTTDDEGYIFGGINTRVPPCNVDLTTTTNVDAAGNILNNYTSATLNIRNVNIAKNNSIKIGIDASNPAFSSLIGAINKLKAANIVDPTTDLKPFKNDIANALSKVESLIADNIVNKQELAKATTSNDSTFIEANDILNSSDFLKSPDEVLQALITFSRSMKILGLLQSLDNKDLQNMIDSYR
jgi:hypothetical protein